MAVGRPALAAIAAVAGLAAGIGHGPDPKAVAHTCVQVGTPTTTIDVLSSCPAHDPGTHTCIPAGDGIGVVVCID